LEKQEEVGSPVLRPGPLVVIGGAESEDGRVLRAFIRLAGGPQAVVAVLATASGEPEGAARRYEEVFRGLGAGRIETLRVTSRRDAFRPDILERAEKATAFFFTGGDQLRITSALGGTSLNTLLHRKHQAGAVIAGTSAGASAMSETMIVAGDSEDALKKCTIKMAPGMGFLEGAVIDQHFAQRGRLGRLLAAVAQNPKVVGLGVDEDTAFIADADGNIRVVGSQTVVVVDGQNISETNASESLPDEALALTDVVLHVLPESYGYDLKWRRPLPPAAAGGPNRQAPTARSPAGQPRKAPGGPHIPPVSAMR